MAHFAVVNKNTSKVIRVDVVDNVKLVDTESVEQESNGVNHLLNVYKLLNEFNISEIDFIQTSYNSNFRKNFAGIGYTWRPDLDGFVPPKPEENPIDQETGQQLQGDWVLNNETCNWEFKVL